MPRIEMTGQAVDIWWETIGEPNGCGGSTFDVCNRCLESKTPAEIIEHLEPYSDCHQEPKGDGLNAWDFELCYREENTSDGENPYRCEVCSKALNTLDNRVSENLLKGGE